MERATNRERTSSEALSEAAATASAFHALVYYRIVTASEPASYRWSISGNPWVDIGVLAYANVNTAAPIDAASGSYMGITNTPLTDSLGTTSANDLLVALFINFAYGGWTVGSGMIQRYDFDSNSAQDAVQANPGPTGRKAAVTSTVGPTTAQIVALRGQ